MSKLIATLETMPPELVVTYIDDLEIIESALGALLAKAKTRYPSDSRGRRAVLDSYFSPPPTASYWASTPVDTAAGLTLQ